MNLTSPFASLAVRSIFSPRVSNATKTISHHSPALPHRSFSAMASIASLKKAEDFVDFLSASPTRQLS